eukprot:763908-Hanusia_phi.AAC.4
MIQIATGDAWASTVTRSIRSGDSVDKTVAHLPFELPPLLSPAAPSADVRFRSPASFHISSQ